MTYAWSARHRLCWPRMIWLETNYNEPEYVLHREYYARGSRLRRYPRSLIKAETKCDRVYLANQLPPKLGKWPVLPRDHRPKRRSPWHPRSGKSS